MEEFRVVEYPVQEVSCPKCTHAIRFTTLHLPFIPQPFMYCQECSNVLFRPSDLERMYNVMNDTTDTIAAALRFYEELEQDAPQCPCGGHFSLWANVKCPTCGYEIPYNEGVHDPKVRVDDNMIVVINGAVVIEDTPEKSWKCKCTTGR